MAALFYWDGSAWLPIAAGGTGGGAPGPQGPAGADGISITVYGPQPTAPLNPRKGDEWINNAAVRDADEDAVILQTPTPEPEKILIKRLPPTPQPVIVYLQ
jgi:hypothetical protein